MAKSVKKLTNEKPEKADQWEKRKLTNKSGTMAMIIGPKMFSCHGQKIS